MPKDYQMKIEDCKTLPEFFGVELGSPLWVEGKYFRVFEAFLISDDYDSSVDGRVLVGCLTGQLEWSTEPMTAEEENILR